jgi:hypothetical protein
LVSFMVGGAVLGLMVIETEKGFSCLIWRLAGSWPWILIHYDEDF